jgi:hypothetical protein
MNQQRPLHYLNSHRIPHNQCSEISCCRDLSKTELDDTLTFASPWVLHDLRRTCRKLMTRARTRPDVAELALGHSIRGIQATYDDRGDAGFAVEMPAIDCSKRSASNISQKILRPTSSGTFDGTLCDS